MQCKCKKVIDIRSVSDKITTNIDSTRDSKSQKAKGAAGMNDDQYSNCYEKFNFGLVLNRSPINYHVTSVFRSSWVLKRPKPNPNPSL